MRVSLKNGARAIKTIMKSTSVCQLIEKTQTTVEIDIFLKFEELVNFSNLFYVFNKEFQKYTHAQTNAWTSSSECQQLGNDNTQNFYIFWRFKSSDKSDFEHLYLLQIES